MHPTAIDNYERFLEKKISDKSLSYTLVDIGSYDVNGTLKPSSIKFLPNIKYIGVDQELGANVDIVADAHNLPFENDSVDIIISSSFFEHDEMFWQTFKEMSRICKSNGWIYICAPSTGGYHAYPSDCWRFYIDSWKALAKWCPQMELIESYLDRRLPWQDCVGIYRKK